MNTVLLNEYARFAVRVGSNIQKGQTLIINAPVEAAYFAQLCAKAAYDAGAREVVVHYADEKMARLRVLYAEEDALAKTYEWQLERYMNYINAEGGAALLSISSRDPEIFKNVDTRRVEVAERALAKRLRPYKEMVMGGGTQWAIVAIPSVAWAEKVFAEKKGTEAVEALWDAIFSVCRMDSADPVEEWEKHIEKIQSYAEWLNSLQLTEIVMKSSNGTNLRVGLADEHIWCGAREYSMGGIPFLPNIPTEEVFTAPHYMKTNGCVRSSLPYSYQGGLIEGIEVEFENGKVVKSSAEKGEELLHKLLGADAGAVRLGEIALVPASSPIRQTGRLFYNTLFDENAACHMAFGAGYPGTVKGGEQMDSAELMQKGVNDSIVHEDIMIGTPDMDIVGITIDKKEVPIFINGEWAK